MDTTSAPREPLPPNSYVTLFTAVGLPKGSPKASALATKFGYTYCGLLGELMFLYVTTHIDIGIALTLLAKLSTAPACIVGR